MYVSAFKGCPHQRKNISEYVCWKQLKITFLLTRPVPVEEFRIQLAFAVANKIVSRESTMNPLTYFTKPPILH